MPRVSAAAVLLGLVLPGCGGNGADGVPMPAPMSMTRLHRPATPNTALAAPSGFDPAPDLVTPPYPVPPRRLYAAVRRVAQAQPRTHLHAAYDDRMQAHYVARSRLLNFPDLVAVQVYDGEGGGGRLVLWSRSVYGHSDFGVNRARLRAWLGALDAALVEGGG